MRGGLLLSERPSGAGGLIVEIGDKPFVASAFPEETVYFSTRSAKDLAPGRTEPSLLGLWRLLGRADLKLVVVHPTFHAPWSWRHLSRLLFSRRALTGDIPLARAFAPQLLRWRGQALIAILDQEDLPLINRNTFFLLDRCRLYFKRELPADHWRVFLKTGHPNLPTARYRLEARHAARVAKLCPLSIGLPMDAPAFPAPGSVEKTADVFFAGRVEGSSTLRADGLAELLALKERGLRVDIPEGPLARGDFYRRCAAAWLVWSPEGYGWDCFRHYEALACGSVPLINMPSIHRYQPLIAGEHALYYEIETGGLTRAVEAALADKAWLEQIAEDGRKHVMARHTPDAIARYVVERTAGG